MNLMSLTIILLFAIGGVLIGCVIGYFIAAYRTNQQVSLLRAEGERCKASLENEQMRRVEEANAVTDLRRELKVLNEELSHCRAETERYKTALQSEQEFRATDAKRIQEMQEKHYAQFCSLADKILEENSTRLKVSNQESMDGLLKPLREQLVHLGKAVHDSNVATAEHKASLEAALKGMLEKTDCLSKDAANLALALKGDSKKQGDWGEVVLERMLEDSGLRKNEEYFIQENFKTEDGRNVRPDVVIRFPDKRCVVIDSKVSLTAYAQYMAAPEHEETRFHYLNAHVASVRKHIDELADKCYDAVVENTISYVLMFVPNEASYIAAVQAAPSLPMEAYKKKIILISPTNLLMALQLAYNLWQKERQSRNVQSIFSRATLLYEKFATVKESFAAVGRSLDAAQVSYNTALSQFSEGKGSFSRQVQLLLKMGITPRKQMQGLEIDEDEP